MTPRHPASRPTAEQLAAENEELRRELKDDAALFARVANKLVGFRTVAGVGATMRVRADRLNKLLNAAEPTPGVPAGLAARP